MLGEARQVDQPLGRKRMEFPARDELLAGPEEFGDRDTPAGESRVEPAKLHPAFRCPKPDRRRELDGIGTAIAQRLHFAGPSGLAAPAAASPGFQVEALSLQHEL